LENKHLHIISFDVPFPADYGGVIDVFYKLRKLSKKKIKIHLHCFQYGRETASILNNFCETVNYYPRKMDKMLLTKPKPFIVESRKCDELIMNLCKDNHPVLFEGLHSCYYLDDPRLTGRTKVVRMHNVEHDYYAGLAKSEGNYFRAKYFKIEARKLKKFESVLANADAIAAISKADAKYFSNHYPNVVEVQAFHPHLNAASLKGLGDYALYHGNLKVTENNKAAIYLVQEVFNELKIPLVIAGSNPSSELKATIAGSKNVTLKERLEDNEMNDLIRNAQINVLPTFQSTGIKLKLLAALFLGRHCVVNKPMVENTGLEGLCEIAVDSKDMRSKIEALFSEEFKDEKKRRELLKNNFSNVTSADRLLEMLY